MADIVPGIGFLGRARPLPSPNRPLQGTRYVRLVDSLPMTVTGTAQKFLVPRAMMEELALMEEKTVYVLNRPGACAAPNPSG
jgi:hypothetical protein